MNEYYNQKNKYYFIIIIIIGIIILSCLLSTKKINICYFDNNSTTFIYDKDVINEINKWLSCGNPSNLLHNFGIDAKNKLDEARYNIADIIKVRSDEIYFTSGATESNNIFIKGVVERFIQTYPNEKFTVISSSCEHSSVLEVCKKLASDKLQIILIDPYNKSSSLCGCIDPDDIENTIRNIGNKVILISIMHGNNETGSMNDIQRIADIANKYNIIYHCDTTQTIGKFKILPKKMGIHSISFSSHKFHGPKGIGCLYVDSNVKFNNLTFGGGQEFGKRPGTENVAFISGMALALHKSHIDREYKNERLFFLRNYLVELLSNVCNFDIIGARHNNIMPNTLLVLLHDIRTCNIEFAKQLGKLNVCISVGSACKKGSPSHVADSICISEEDKSKLIRISLSDYSTKNECKYFVSCVQKLFNDGF